MTIGIILCAGILEMEALLAMEVLMRPIKRG
jgi:hypothetical protein